jgi:hypothetical protein
MTASDGTTRITRIGTVILPVSDQDQARAFYRDTWDSRYAWTGPSVQASGGSKSRHRVPRPPSRWSRRDPRPVSR